MTSITMQKADLRDILHGAVMKEYDEADEAGKRSLVESLLGRYTGKMTLRELRAWHRGLILRQSIIENYRQATREKGKTP